jgi:hypothetical protein
MLLREGPVKVRDNLKQEHGVFNQKGLPLWLGRKQGSLVKFKILTVVNTDTFGLLGFDATQGRSNLP